jgi:hypothetical protein
LAFVDTGIELQSVITVNDEIVSKINSYQFGKRIRYIFSQNKNIIDIVESAKKVIVEKDNNETPPYNKEAKKLYDKIMQQYNY